jgi:hypothetical protein
MTDGRSPSPLGRYDAGASPASELHEVRLLGVPVEIFRALRQQHDELMREFAVMALAHRDEDASEPEGLRALIRELGVHYAPSRWRTNEEIDAATEAGLATVDLTYHVSESVLRAADELGALMASADQFCRHGRMLTMPRSPLMVRFSAWWVEELRRQVAGCPPTPWPGPVTRSRT